LDVKHHGDNKRPFQNFFESVHKINNVNRDNYAKQAILSAFAARLLSAGLSFTLLKSTRS
jgi:hypothetical protein